MSLARRRLDKAIHSQRFLILQEYLFLYGARLKGEKSLHEMFDGDEIELSSDEGQAYMESIMDVEMYERQLADMLKKSMRMALKAHKD